MSSIKIYPPNTLPQEGISDVQFEIWRETLEVYLEIEEKFRKFLPDGRYENWIASEINDKRILQAIEPDKAENLQDIRRDLRQFLTIVAKYVHMDFYNPIQQQSTSIKWIYKKIREDYDIMTQGIHYFNLLDLTWDPTGQQSAIGFYNQYRSMIISNLAKKSTYIEWKNESMKENETLTPSHEDLILLNVLGLLHPKLPAYVRENYSYKLGSTKRLMDFKTEILTKCKQYIQDIDQPIISNVMTEEDPQCNYISSQQYRGNTRGNWRGTQRRPQNNSYRQRPTGGFQQSTQASSFCRLCHISGLSRTIYSSHFLGQESCPSLSQKDKQMLSSRLNQQLSALNIEEEEEDDLAKEYGYDDLEDQQQQVKKDYSYKQKKSSDKNKDNAILNDDLTTDRNSISNRTACNFITPIATQTLTVSDVNNSVINIDLDTGATSSFAKLSAVISHGFKIKPNSQLSNLADGKTSLPSLGEIDEIFHRNSWSVRFHAIVVKDLHCNFVGGNNFIKENSVIQDLNARTISIHKKYTVSETSKSLILPTQPNNLILQNSHLNVILPGQAVAVPVPHQDDTQVAVQPWHQNKQFNWPQPQICSVKNGQILIKNNLKEPVQVKNQKIQARTLSNFENSTNQDYKSTAIEEIKDADNTNKIEINEDSISHDVIDYIKEINHTFKDVFNEDLNTGYNHRYGKHICSLNWADQNRPTATKVQHIDYDHQTKQLLQEVIDDLTEKNVLGIPQDFGINVQYCSPSFLVRKQKAKNKSKEELTKNDVRLVVNFSKLNDHLKNLPTSVTKPRQIFSQLGQWNFIITMDLSSGFFQNHMNNEDASWLGITSPFGGMRFLRRSGQGLIGQSEELDEVLCKVLGPEMKDRIVSRIADDIYIGGATERETADNYKRVLQKLQSANIKISAGKTKIFLKSVDILGWKWSQGGFLSPSPHRVNALRNTKFTDIKTVKDLRSYLGLFKTLLPSSPNLTLILNPFDQEVADRDSKELIEWNRTLQNHFKVATEAVEQLQTLYLPSPDDQLLIEVDAAKTPPGIGHTVYAIKEGKKLPVSFHSVKLDENHSKWMACELEALAFATAINAEMNTIKECKNPVIISPDSKPVADAVKLIRKGLYSTSPRIQSFINNINRIPIVVQLASGKNKQNISSDFQSRHPTKCTSQHCSVCNFISESSDSVLIPTAINSVDTPESMNNRTAWNKVQDQQKATREAKSLLKSGKTPNKLSGKLNSEIRRLCSVAKVNKDNLLVVPSQINKYSTVQNELTVIPQTHLPAILWQLHNNNQHPCKSQLKAQFEKMFYSVGLIAALEQLYNDCFYCSTQKKIPVIAKHQTTTETEVPGTNFHADVIRRQSQYLFTIRDNFSSYTAARIIKNENHQELKKAIIDTVMAMKLAGNCSIRVDNGTGFSPLSDKKDPDLNKLNIDIIKTDVFNKNGNAVIDKACTELEQELKRIEPDGRPVSNTTLQLAVEKVNTKLRRNGQISAYEIHFNRDMYTGKNLNLDYTKIKKEQLEVRNKQNEINNRKIPEQAVTDPKPGDMVVIRGKYDKHKANDVFIVSDRNEEKVTIQKVIHSHTNKASIRSKQYVTDKNRIYVTSKFLPPQSKQPTIIKKNNFWNPIRSDSDNEDSDIKIVNDKQNIEPSKSHYQARIRIQQQQQHKPQLYENLDESIQHQRLEAARQLNKTRSMENIHSNDQPTIRASTRKQSTEAKRKISSLYNKQNRNIIPQIDGTLTDTESQQSYHHSKPRHSSTQENLLDQTDNQSQQSDDSSLHWDYSDNLELEQDIDTNDVFCDPAHDNSFMHPPLNLSASSPTMENRVYNFTSLLQRMSSTIQSYTESPINSEPLPEKKGDADQH